MRPVIRIDISPHRLLVGRSALRLGRSTSVDARPTTASAAATSSAVRGAADHPDAVITTTTRDLDALVSGDRTLDELVGAGDAATAGDAVAAHRFAAYFAPR